MLVAHLILLGKLFHKTAVDVSNSLFPCRTVSLRFGTSDVVDADRNVLQVYTNEVNRTCMKAFASEAPLMIILYWHRLFLGSHIKCCNVGFIGWCLGIRATTRAAVFCANCNLYKDFWASPSVC